MIAVDGFFIAGIIIVLITTFTAGYALRRLQDAKSVQKIVSESKIPLHVVSPLSENSESGKLSEKILPASVLSFWVKMDLIDRQIIETDEKLQSYKDLLPQAIENILTSYLKKNIKTPIFINLLNDQQQQITLIALNSSAGSENLREVKFDLLLFQNDHAQQFLHLYRSLVQFVEELPIGVGILDEQGQFIQANQKLEQQIYRTPDSLEEKKLSDFAVTTEVDLISKKLQEVLTNYQMQYLPEVKWKTNKGQTSQLILQPWPWFNFVILYALDITLQRRLESQVNQSHKMQAIGQLAGGIAHDFNNLLTAMIGFCDLLLIRHRPGDQSFADIMQIKQNSHRAANLVRQLLAFSRQQNLQPKVLVLTDLLAELSHLLKRLIGANVELDIIHGQNLFPIKADPTQLEQVIINLAVNSRDAMPSGGKLLITTENRTLDSEMNVNNETIPSGDYVLLSIQDTGTGISPEIMDRIFDPFFSTKEIGKGTGLGLSTVYGIIKQTKGYIFVESALGKGTVFYIYLPKYQAEQNIKEINDNDLAASKIEDLTGVGNILLVEDEDAVRIFSARALRNKGYQVIEARSGEAALEIIKQQAAPIDLLVSDVMMPQMDGPTLIREAYKIIPDLKVIFISGYAEDSFRQRLQNDQGIQFLPKPFSLKQLAEKVQNVLKTKR